MAYYRGTNEADVALLQAVGLQDVPHVSSISVVYERDNLVHAVVNIVLDTDQINAVAKALGTITQGEQC